MPQTIIIWGERPTLPEQKPPLASGRFVFFAKTAAFLAVMAGIYWGPPYMTCRHMKERGLFYYGTTISSCVQERIDSRSNPFEAITKHILPVL